MELTRLTYEGVALYVGMKIKETEMNSGLTLERKIELACEAQLAADKKVLAEFRRQEADWLESFYGAHSEIIDGSDFVKQQFMSHIAQLREVKEK